MKEKQIQIPQTLFAKLLKYHFIEQDPELQKEIEKGLEIKLDAMLKHDLYTQSKTAGTEEEREKARKEYLDKIGMRQDFRW